MYDELSAIDIKKMQEEIDYRINQLRPQLIADLQEARAHGDLSENYEYKAAKSELRRCDSRIRYLNRMIETARVIKPTGSADTADLFDKVDIYYIDDDETETITIMTTLRNDAVHSIISKESPLGRAVMGRKVGDICTVKVNEDYSYKIRIDKIVKGADDDSLPISAY